MFMSIFTLAAVALATIHADSICADAASDTVALPAGPYCPPFAVTPAQQKAIFEHFYQGFLVTGKPGQALDEHIADDYIQHNPNFLSGKAGVVAAFSGDLTKFGIFEYPAHLINKVFDPSTGVGSFHYYHTPAAGAQPKVIVDTFRFNGSCIQEHWDVIQERPANATNPLAMF